MTRAAVILVNYNNGIDLPECLKSLAAQSYRDFEIIVVDNGSTDMSAELLARDFPEIKVIAAGSNVGFAAGCNLGIKATDAEYLVFLNCDTAAEPDWLAALVAAADAAADAGVFTSKIMLYDQRDIVNTTGTKVQYLGFGWSGDFGVVDSGQFSGGEVASGSGASMLVKRAVLEKTGLFDETFFMYHEDTDLCWRARLVGYRVLFVPESVVYHKYHFGKGSYKFYHLEKNRLHMCLKNYRAKTLLLLFPIFLFSEAGMLMYFLLTWRLGGKLKSYCYIAGRWRAIIKQRRTIQATRSVTDREIVRLFEARIDSESVDNVVQRFIANPIYRVYWAAVRRII